MLHGNQFSWHQAKLSWQQLSRKRIQTSTVIYLEQKQDVTLENRYRYLQTRTSRGFPEVSGTYMILGTSAERRFLPLIVCSESQHRNDKRFMLSLYVLQCNYSCVYRALEAKWAEAEGAAVGV